MSGERTIDSAKRAWSVKGLRVALAAQRDKAAELEREVADTRARSQVLEGALLRLLGVVDDCDEALDIIAEAAPRLGCPTCDAGGCDACAGFGFSEVRYDLDARAADASESAMPHRLAAWGPIELAPESEDSGQVPPTREPGFAWARYENDRYVGTYPSREAALEDARRTWGAGGTLWTAQCAWPSVEGYAPVCIVEEISELIAGDLHLDSDPLDHIAPEVSEELDRDVGAAVRAWVRRHDVKVDAFHCIEVRKHQPGETVGQQTCARCSRPIERGEAHPVVRVPDGSEVPVHFSCMQGGGQVDGQG